MHIFNKFRGTRGFVSLWQETLRFRYMITEQAKHRVKILAFWERHGDEATGEAFDVSRRSLFRWQAHLRHAGGKLDGLNVKSTAPHRRRKRIVPDGMMKLIIELRTAHPRLDKEKLKPLLGARGYRSSISTLGRILGDLTAERRLPSRAHLSLQGRTGRLTERVVKPKRKLRRPQGYRVLEVDTVVRFIDGVKRFVLTGIDTERRSAFAAAYTSHGSASAADFLGKTRAVLPDCPSAVQTDNGSEFALHFASACATNGVTHYHTYPKSPKMNAHVERFNRTLSEEFLQYRRGLLRDDVRAFNEQLIDWLLWYNAERPHFALGQQAPFRAMMPSLPAEECHMWWTHTRT